MKRTFREFADMVGFSPASLNKLLEAAGLGPIQNPDSEMGEDSVKVLCNALDAGDWPAPQHNALQRLAVGGFKAFGQEQQIPLRPITLVFGPNSAGKSSLLHSLLFAHEAATTGKLDVYEPTLAEGSIDLGGFNQFTFCQRTEDRPITLDFTLRPDDLNRFIRDRLGEDQSIRAGTVTIGVVLAVIPELAKRDKRHGQPALTRLDVSIDGRRVCQAGRTGEGELTFRTVDFDHPFFAGVRASYVELLRPVSADPSKAEGRVTALFQEVVPRTSLISANRPGLFPSKAVFRAPEFITPEPIEPFTDPEGLVDEEHKRDFEEEDAEVQDGLKHDVFSPGDPDYETVTALMARFADLLGDFVRAACQPLLSNLNEITYLGPLRSFPARDFTLTHSRDSHWNSGGGFAWDVLAADASVRAKVNEWFASGFLQTPYQFVVTDLVSGEIISSAIESELSDIVHEKSEEHDKKRASRDQQDLEAFAFPYDAWDTDELGKRISSKAIERAKASRRTELRLIDKRTGARVSHRDVGVGLSQILPILVRAFSEKEKLHLIEQPEIHVHPKLQAELGDVFINSALGEPQNRFLIETHSEHLILRILRRIRQTTAEDADYLKNGAPVRPEDVAVIYAEPTKEGTKLHHLRITPDGDFADRWPHGFFTERGAELFT